MSIRDEARAEAEIQFPARDPREGETTYPWSSIAVFKRGAFAMGYIAGANREPSDVEVGAAAEAIRYDSRPETEAHTVDWPVDEHDAREIARAALIAAQEVRHEDQ